MQALAIIFDLDKACGLIGEKSFAYKYEMEGGLDTLEELQKHPNITVFEEVDKLITKYFDEDDSQ